MFLKGIKNMNLKFYEPDPSEGKDIAHMDVEELVTLRENLKLYQYNKLEFLKSKKDKFPKATRILRGINTVLFAGLSITMLAFKLFAPELIMLTAFSGVGALVSGFKFAKEMKAYKEYKNLVKETETKYTDKINEINRTIEKNYPNYKYKADAINIADQVIAEMKHDAEAENQAAERATAFAKYSKRKSLKNEKISNNDLER